jgi:hypothetical protein
MRRWSTVAALTCGVGCVGLLAAGPDPVAVASVAGASSSSVLSVRVSPSRALVDGQSVTVSGRVRATGGTNQKWFVIECTASVQGHVDPDTDADHCDVTHARAIRVSRNGSFATTFHVVTGIVGDGHCGTDGHRTCVLGVGTASGRGTVVRIGFKVPSLPPGSPPPAPTAPPTT